MNDNNMDVLVSLFRVYLRFVAQICRRHFLHASIALEVFGIPMHEFGGAVFVKPLCVRSHPVLTVHRFVICDKSSN